MNLPEYYQIIELLRLQGQVPFERFKEAVEPLIWQSDSEQQIKVDIIYKFLGDVGGERRV